MTVSLSLDPEVEVFFARELEGDVALRVLGGIVVVASAERGKDSGRLQVLVLEERGSSTIWYKQCDAVAWELLQLLSMWREIDGVLVMLYEW